MSVSVKNVQIEDLEFGDVAAKLEKAYPFLKLDQAERKRIKELTPTHTRRVKFDVVASTAIANGWRRVILDEIVWPRFTCSMQDDIRSDDAFNARLTDYIQNRVQLIPTSYLAPDKDAEDDKDDKEEKKDDKKEKKDNKKPVYKIDVKNATQQGMIVRSSDIEHVSGPKLTWDHNVDICNLMPGRFVRVQIGVDWGVNRNYATYSNFHGVLYRPLTVAKAALNYEKLPPSYSVHPDSYMLGLTCEEFVDPKMVARLGWQTLVDKLSVAATRIAEFNGKLPYITDHLLVTQIRGGVIRYEFKGETLTLTNIISWYAYEADRSVTYLQAGDDHPEDPSSLIRIVHADHARLLAQAATRAAKDCETLMKAF